MSTGCEGHLGTCPSPLDLLRRRVERAEAELQALREAVEALADEAEADIPYDAGNATAHLIANRLRALLTEGGEQA